MYDELKPLDDAQLEDFFLRRQDWKPGDPYPATTWQVARHHIFPNLGDGFAANTQRQGEENVARGFHDLVASYVAAHKFEWPDVINAIIDAIFRDRKQPFQYNTIAQSIRLFAQYAANGVSQLINATDREGQRAREMVSQDVLASIESSLARPERVLDRIALVQMIYMGLKGRRADKWLVLGLLKEGAKYEWLEIVRAFTTVRDLRATGMAWENVPAELYNHSQWSAPGKVSSSDLPVHPHFVWPVLKKPFTLPVTLPEWLPNWEGQDAVHTWYPRPALTVGAFTKFYERGLDHIV